MKIGGELNKVNEAQFNVIIFGEKYWHGELLIMRNLIFTTNSDKQIKQQNSNKINKNKWSVCLFLLSSFCPFYVQIPMASTCFNMLKLTSYSSEKHLKDKLLIAIRHGAEGFSFSWGVRVSRFCLYILPTFHWLNAVREKRSCSYLTLLVVFATRYCCYVPVIIGLDWAANDQFEESLKELLCKRTIIIGLSVVLRTLFFQELMN